MGSLGPGGLENETGAVQDYLYLWEIAEKFMLFIDPIAMYIVCALYADGRGSTSGALGCPRVPYIGALSERWEDPPRLTSEQW
jgi:hypothetical protein